MFCNGDSMILATVSKDRKALTHIMGNGRILLWAAQIHACH
jgi:hypothetical protein